MTSVPRMAKDFPVFDCDGHINDPEVIWTKYLEPEYREAVKRTYWKDDQQALLNARTEVRGGGRSEFTGSYSGVTVAGPGMNKKLLKRLQRMELTPGQKDYLDHKGNFDPAARTHEMDLMGIDQVVIIPTMIVNHLLYADDVTAAYALYRAYNNWAFDYCSAAPERLFPAAMIPVQNYVYCIEELNRVARKGSHVALVRPVDVKGRYPNRIFPGWGGPVTMDHVFKTFESTGMVLGMHTFPAIPVEPSPTMTTPGELILNAARGTDRSIDSGVFSFTFEAMTWLTQVLLSGLLDRYPKLKMAIFESNGTWLPALLERCDRIFKLYRNERTAPAERLPAEAFHNQCFIAFEGDEVGVFRQWDRFTDTAVWSSDAYHHDGADSWTAIREMEKERVPKAAMMNMLGGNARRMYGIEGKLFVREQLEIPRPDWFPRQDAEFQEWWREVSNPRAGGAGGRPVTRRVLATPR